MKQKFILGSISLMLGALLAWSYFAGQRSDWKNSRQLLANENARLKALLDQGPPPAATAAPVVIEKQKLVAVAKQADPREILAILQAIRIGPGPTQNRNTRVAIQQFENLIATGTNALPDIREFLLRNEEIDYESSMGPRGSRDGRIATDFTVPPSLRFGLFDAVRQIGSDAAEALLAEILSTTARGVEIAYLTRVLDEIAPGKYRATAIAAARDLLNAPANGSANGLDKFDREYLFGVLALYRDASFAPQAQAQLARADGSVDRGALKYLQETLGEGALPIVSELYRNSALDPAQKEPLGRFALLYAGVNEQGTDLWHHSIMDKNLSMDARQNMIEDLNDEGYENLRSPTPRDLQLIRNRLALIDRFQAEADHKLIAAAFAEAQKDLQNMLAKHGKPAQ